MQAIEGVCVRSNALWLAVVPVLALASLAGAVAPAAAGERRLTVLERIVVFQEETWRWERLMGKPTTRTEHSARRSRAPQYRRWVLDLWRSRAQRMRRQGANPPHLAQWRCIHRGERSPAQGWATNTGNGYYGGLQMNLSFMRAYGRGLLARKGTADRWTPLEQMWVAERAHASGRGFTPWPNTARACGLL
jgi:hypothetical protein